MSDPERMFLTTIPGTRISFEIEHRDRPCWRCRLFLRWPPWHKHWGCSKPYPIKDYIS